MEKTDIKNSKAVPWIPTAKVVLSLRCVDNHEVIQGRTSEDKAANVEEHQKLEVTDTRH